MLLPLGSSVLNDLCVSISPFMSTTFHWTLQQVIKTRYIGIKTFSKHTCYIGLSLWQWHNELIWMLHGYRLCESERRNKFPHFLFLPRKSWCHCIFFKVSVSNRQQCSLSIWHIVFIYIQFIYTYSINKSLN